MRKRLTAMLAIVAIGFLSAAASPAATSRPATLDAYIDGPGSVTYEGTSTWYAVPSGGDGNYTYQWSAYWMRSGGWETLGTSSDQSLYVVRDHGSFELWLTVSSNGETFQTSKLVCNFISPTDFACD